jgi:NAD dependent epimerase/dehydratase family enzyme
MATSMPHTQHVTEVCRRGEEDGQQLQTQGLRCVPVRVGEYGLAGNGGLVEGKGGVSL